MTNHWSLSSRWDPMLYTFEVCEIELEYPLVVKSLHLLGFQICSGLGVKWERQRVVAATDNVFLSWGCLHSHPLLIL